MKSRIHEIREEGSDPAGLSFFCGSGSVYQGAQGRNIGQGSLIIALRASLLC